MLSFLQPFCFCLTGVFCGVFQSTGEELWSGLFGSFPPDGPPTTGGGSWKAVSRCGLRQWGCKEVRGMMRRYKKNMNHHESCFMFINNDGEVIVVYWPKMDDQNWYVKWVQYSNSEPQALWGDHVMAATSYTLRRYDVEHLPEWSSYPVVLMRMRVRQGISVWIYGRFVRFLKGKMPTKRNPFSKNKPPTQPDMFVKGILARVSQEKAREFLNWCGVAGKRLGNRFWSRRVTEERVSCTHMRVGLSFFNTFTVWYLFLFRENPEEPLEMNLMFINVMFMKHYFHIWNRLFRLPFSLFGWPVLHSSWGYFPDVK